MQGNFNHFFYVTSWTNIALAKVGCDVTQSLTCSDDKYTLKMTWRHAHTRRTSSIPSHTDLAAAGARAEAEAMRDDLGGELLDLFAERDVLHADTVLGFALGAHWERAALALLERQARVLGRQAL